MPDALSITAQVVRAVALAAAVGFLAGGLLIALEDIPCNRDQGCVPRADLFQMNSETLGVYTFLLVTPVFLLTPLPRQYRVPLAAIRSALLGFVATVLHYLLVAPSSRTDDGWFLSIMTGAAIFVGTFLLAVRVSRKGFGRRDEPSDRRLDEFGRA